MKLTAELVRELMSKCLVKDQESLSQPDTVVVEGVVRSFAFQSKILQIYEATIVDLLSQLPQSFKKSVGGGWSFLNACMDKDGHQWGEQSSVEELMCLGLAIGKVEYCLPRDFWSSLPGGVPYFCIIDK